MGNDLLRVVWQTVPSLEVEPDPVIFTVEGEPQTKGSWRGVPTPRGVVFKADNPMLKGWTALAHARAREAARGRVLNGPVSMRLYFYFARPAGHWAAGGGLSAAGRAAPRPATQGRHDLDKLCRAALDAFTGAAYVDDGLVVRLTAAKLWRPDGPGKEGFTYVEIGQLT